MFHSSQVSVYSSNLNDSITVYCNKHLVVVIDCDGLFIFRCLICRLDVIFLAYKLNSFNRSVYANKILYRVSEDYYETKRRAHIDMIHHCKPMSNCSR